MKSGDQGRRGDAVLSADAYEGQRERSAAGEPVGGVARDAEQLAGGDHVGGGAECLQILDVRSGIAGRFRAGGCAGAATIGQDDSQS